MQACMAEFMPDKIDANGKATARGGDKTAWVREKINKAGNRYGKNTSVTRQDVSD